MKEKIRAGIIGGAGYTGGETIRLLLNHPDVSLVFVHSRSHAGHPLHHIHKDLVGETDLAFTGQLDDEADVVILCLGHGESKKFLEAHPLSESTRIIDLSQDFRLGDTVGGKEFVYGLPELNREAIASALDVANPGCFATAITLGLLPAVRGGWVEDVYTTGITGSTGAGQKLQETTQFTWRVNNISAYKTLTHQHLREIVQTLKQTNPSYHHNIQFVPWRGDFARGIFVSSCFRTSLSREEIETRYRDFYAGHPFTHVVDGTLDLKQVVNTNKCLIQIEKEGDHVVVHSAIDNLLKGASGQAIQNMNLMFGLEETAGLKLKSIVF